MYAAVYTRGAAVHDVSVALVTEAVSRGMVGVQWCKAAGGMFSNYTLWFNEDKSPYADTVPAKSVLAVFPSLVDDALPPSVVAACKEWLEKHERTEPLASGGSSDGSGSGSGSDNDDEDGDAPMSAAAGSGSAAAAAPAASHRTTRSSGKAAAAAEPPADAAAGSDARSSAAPKRGASNKAGARKSRKL